MLCHRLISEAAAKGVAAGAQHLTRFSVRCRRRENAPLQQAIACLRCLPDRNLTGTRTCHNIFKLIVPRKLKPCSRVLPRDWQCGCRRQARSFFDEHASSSRRNACTCRVNMHVRSVCTKRASHAMAIFIISGSSRMMPKTQPSIRTASCCGETWQSRSSRHRRFQCSKRLLPP